MIERVERDETTAVDARTAARASTQKAMIGDNKVYLRPASTTTGDRRNLYDMYTSKGAAFPGA